MSTIHPQPATPADHLEPASRRERRGFARRIDCDWADARAVKTAPARGGEPCDPEAPEPSRVTRD